MGESKEDIRSDIKADLDRAETLGLMEPLVLSEGSPHRATLNDLSLELASASTGFRRSLPAGVVRALADLVRAMNCYYSNLMLALGWWYGYRLGVRHTEQRWSDAVGRVERHRRRSKQ